MTSTPSPKPISTIAEEKPSLGGDYRSATAISKVAEDEAADLSGRANNCRSRDSGRPVAQAT